MADRKELLRRLFERCKAVHNELVRVEGISLLANAMAELGVEREAGDLGEVTRALGPYLFFAAPPRLVGSSFGWRLRQGASAAEVALLDDLRDHGIFGAWEVSFEEGRPWAVGVPPVDEAQAEPARLARALDADGVALVEPGLHTGILLPMAATSRSGNPGDGVGPWLVFARPIAAANADALREFAGREGWTQGGRFDGYEYACDVLIANLRADAPRSSWSDLLFAREAAGRQLDTYVRTTMLRMVREEGLAHSTLGRVHWSVALSAVDDEAAQIAMATDLCERLRAWNSRYYYGRDNRLAGVDHEVRRRLRDWLAAVAAEGDEEESVPEAALGGLPVEELPIDGELLARAGAPTKGPLSTLRAWLEGHPEHAEAGAICDALRRLRWRLRWRGVFASRGVRPLQEQLFGTSYRDDATEYPALRDAVHHLFPEVGGRTVASLPWERSGSRSRLLKGLGRGPDATVEALLDAAPEPSLLPGVGGSTAEDAAEALLGAVREADRALVARFGAGAQAARDEAASGLDELEALFGD